ncbi:quinon protein alcohol dehydrogenase-like superfamily [Dichotomocladium elegans]|nr:quinon protein alcohol dehydrogenase-like superfamily [Dichotomocladium elegans]
MLTVSCEKEAISRSGSCGQSSSSTRIGREDLLVVALGGTIYCLDKRRQGARLWKARVESLNVMDDSHCAVFVSDEDKVFAGGDGKTVAFDLYTGRLLWRHKVKSLLAGQVGAICTPSQILGICDAPPQQPPPPSYDEDDLPRTIVISCTNGKVLAIDAATGEDMWLFECPNGGSYVSAIIDPPAYYHTAYLVYVGCAGWLYCVHARTGVLQWSTKVRSSFFARFCKMTIVTRWSSRLSAEAHTSLNNFPYHHDDD